MSSIENALTSNPALAPMAPRSETDADPNSDTDPGSLGMRDRRPVV